MKYIITILLPLLFVGCTVSNLQVERNLTNDNLNILLSTLNDKINKKEAKTLSHEMFIQAKFLKESYDLVSPPLFHNFLVNIGIKEKGLCWHFAQDMLEHAKSLELNSFDYYIGGANLGDYWKEHTTLIVTCKGCKFDDGIVLDPWRNSGKLFYSKIKNDTQYIWYQRGNKRN
ncbi:MAG: hypothetical protein ACNI28_02820 [Arcobacter sp.]|uniref:hypothetical protein n=1 Tax=Arcobacter sp. TaxID=1872629 RepID=UPI003B0053E8